MLRVQVLHLYQGPVVHEEPFFKIEIQLIYNTVLISGVQQSDSIYIFFFRFFSL